MAGFIVQQSAQGACDHQGMAQPTANSPRVKVGGEPIITAPASYSVAGCTNYPPGPNPMPCVSLMFTTGATRLRASGQPVLLSDASATAIGPMPVQGKGSLRAVQSRVKGQ